jgi:hypothetical protein
MRQLKVLERPLRVQGDARRSSGKSEIRSLRCFKVIRNFGFAG